ncbi:MAG: hypothetical protein B7Z73_14510 [Planctomycetia bacterium 21-64-5]|nr:MAG: hypothetical protein B7Z73_14510 [Planctomycetia bacterium 21-64-5]HQU46370.1 hypothetical protein [Pirellulales bacterium]
MISFFCPYCKHVQETFDEQAGTLVVCEQCKLEIRVPKPAAPPQLPSAAMSGQAVSVPFWKRLFARTK